MSLDLGHLGLDRSHVPGGDRHPLDVAEVNAECLVLGVEGVDVHGLADPGVAGADALGMRHEAAEVCAGESPFAKGAHVDLVGEVGIVLAGLQPLQHLTSLGVPILVVAADVAAVHLFHIKRKP